MFVTTAVRSILFPPEQGIEVCKSCGQCRIFNLRTNKPSEHYQRPGQQMPEPVVEEDEQEETNKKTKKQSRDLRAKRTSSPTYAEKVRSKYGYKRGF